MTDPNGVSKRNTDDTQIDGFEKIAEAQVRMPLPHRHEMPIEQQAHQASGARPYVQPDEPRETYKGRSVFEPDLPELSELQPLTDEEIKNTAREALEHIHEVGPLLRDDDPKKGVNMQNPEPPKSYDSDESTFVSSLQPERPEFVAGQVDVSEYIKAQGRFIHAQNTFIVTHDIAQYSMAQGEFITAQNRLLNQLGII